MGIFSGGLDGISGFGSMSAGEFEQLRKAAESDYGLGGTGQTGNEAWTLEFLESTMAVLTIEQKHIVFYDDLAKPSVTSTAVEYARRTDLGSDTGGWYDSGELPLTHDASYDRGVGFVKFLGDVREIELPFLHVRTLVEKRAEKIKTGGLWLLRKLEKTLFKGNSKLGVKGAEAVEVDGVETFIERDIGRRNIVNLWGAPLEEDNIGEAGQIIVEAPGMGTHVYLPNKVYGDYNRSYRAHERITMPVPGGGLAAGLHVDTLHTESGDFRIKPIYLYGGLTREIPPTKAGPRTPTPGPGVSITDLSGTDGYWGASLGLELAGEESSARVTYKITYGNKYGECLPVPCDPSSQVLTHRDRRKKLRLTITNPIGFMSSPTFFAIYRQDTDAEGITSPWGCVAREPLTTADPGGVTTWDDDGGNMPGTYRAWVGQLDEDTLHLGQLLPFTRIPLAKQSLTERFALVMFPVFIMRAADRWVEIRNIGRRTF